jgi:hypothetical protein
VEGAERLREDDDIDLTSPDLIHLPSLPPSLPPSFPLPGGGH